MSVNLRFSVLMSVYRGDSASLFRMALASVFDNTEQPDQVVLVVDGPVGSELECVVAHYEANFEYLRVIRLEENGGLTRALNIGLKHVTNPWIARADADDINFKDRFADQIEHILSGAEVDVIGGQIVECDSDGTYIATRSLPVQHSEIVSFARSRNPINHMTAFYKTELVKSVGGYPDFPFREDYALWAAMLHAGAKFHNLPKVLVSATTGSDMYKRRGGVRYVVSDARLQLFLVECGLKGYLRAILDFMLRGAVFLMPSGLRSMIYKKFLRS